MLQRVKCRPWFVSKRTSLRFSEKITVTSPRLFPLSQGLQRTSVLQTKWQFDRCKFSGREKIRNSTIAERKRERERNRFRQWIAEIRVKETTLLIDLHREPNIYVTCTYKTSINYYPDRLISCSSYSMKRASHDLPSSLNILYRKETFAGRSSLLEGYWVLLPAIDKCLFHWLLSPFALVVANNVITLESACHVKLVNKKKGKRWKRKEERRLLVWSEL